MLCMLNTVKLEIKIKKKYIFTWCYTKGNPNMAYHSET